MKENLSGNKKKGWRKEGKEYINKDPFFNPIRNIERARELDQKLLVVNIALLSIGSWLNENRDEYDGRHMMRYISARLPLTARNCFALRSIARDMNEAGVGELWLLKTIKNRFNKPFLNLWVDHAGLGAYYFMQVADYVGRNATIKKSMSHVRQMIARMDFPGRRKNARRAARKPPEFIQGMNG